MYEGHTNSRSSSVRLKTWPRIDIISAKDSWSLKHLFGGELFVQLCNPLLPKLETQPALKIWGDLVSGFSLKMTKNKRSVLDSDQNIDCWRDCSSKGALSQVVHTGLEKVSQYLEDQDHSMKLSWSHPLTLFLITPTHIVWVAGNDHLAKRQTHGPGNQGGHHVAHVAAGHGQIHLITYWMKCEIFWCTWTRDWMSWHVLGFLCPCNKRSNDIISIIERER